MKKVLLGTIAMGAMLAVPAISLAATYEYVNTSGTLSTVTADTAYQALVTAPNIAAHSGVLLVVPTTTVTVTTPVVTPVTTTTTTTVVPPTNTSTDTSVEGTYMSYWSGLTQAPMATSTASTTQTMTLTLNQDHTATLMTSYTNGQASMTENGSWTLVPTNDGSGMDQVQLTLAGTATQTYNPLHMITYTMNGDVLTASSYTTGVAPGDLSFTKE